MPEIKIDEKTSVQTTPKVKKNFHWLMSQIINTDFDNIGDYLISDVLIPAIKNTAATFGKNFIDMFFYGESKGNYGIGSSASTYHNAFNGNNGVNKPKNNFQESGEFFIFTSSEINSRGDAEITLYKLGCIIDDWGFANVSNLYSICNETAPYTYDGYGWRSLLGASVSLAPNGIYCIKLPRPVLLKKK